MSQQAPESTVEQTVESISKSLIFYRVMAYLVGTMLVILTCIGVPLKYVWHNDLVVRLTGIPHGWLYMVLVISAFLLGRKVHWTWLRFILIGLAGTVPFLSFVAEYFARKDVRRRMADLRDGKSLPEADNLM